MQKITKRCDICNGIPETGHTTNCSNQEVFLTHQEPLPDLLPIPEIKQGNLLEYTEMLNRIFPKGYIIVIAPDQGYVFGCWKFNPFGHKMFELIYQFVCNITNWKAEGQN